MTNQFASTQRVRRKRALDAAGYVYVQGWMPAGPQADLAMMHINAARPEVERIADAANDNSAVL